MSTDETAFSTPLVHPGDSHPVYLVKLLGVAALYTLLAKVVLLYFSDNGVVSIVWPPSGLALAVLLIGGKRYLPGIFLGAVLANTMTGLAWGVAVAIAVGNTLEAALGAWLLTRRGRFDTQFNAVRDYLRLILLAGFVACSVAALNGSTTLLLYGFVASGAYFSNLLHWWMGDILGIVMVTPLILAWRRLPVEWLEPKPMAEAMALFGLFFLANQIVFLEAFHDPQGMYAQIARGYWMFLLIVVMAIRFQTQGVALALVMTAAQALVGALHEVGFFAHDIANTQLITFWFYIMTLSVVGMSLATYVGARRRTEIAMRQHKVAIDTAHDGFWITNESGILLEVNKAYAEMSGYGEDELLGRHIRQFEAKEQSLQEIREHIAKISTQGWDVFETRHRRKDGQEIDVEVSASFVPESKLIVSFLRDITRRKEAERQIEHLAFYDPLTGLPNRRLLQDRLAQALSSSVRQGHKGALLFIDLDNFKSINDTLGHDVGDLLLQQAAQRIHACVREGDTVARPGGDEFVVMLSDLSEEAIEAASKAELVGEKILAALKQPYRLSGHECHNSSSIGATLFGEQKHAVDELMKQADIAMYQAKKAGGSAFRFFDPEMQMSINSLAAVEDALRTALANREFALYFQIQVDNSLRPMGAEALIRWMHPVRGLVSPAQFIPLAEGTGQILAIGKWVIETACAQLRAWQDDGCTRDLVLAVNVSAKQFRQTDFVSQVRTAVKRYAIDPKLLKLELTESMLVSNIEETIQTMSELREVGVRFSLDDFGTGYSSLQYLKRLPFDQVKIDQSFVRDVVTDSSDKAIVRTIIAMAYGLNLEVIAEGVETEAQRQLLLKKGCRHYQGYLFGKPVPIREFEAALRKVETSAAAAVL